MEMQASMTDLFEPEQYSLSLRHPTPGSPKQIRYAEIIASKSGIPLPGDLKRDGRRLSDWIDAHKSKPAGGRFSHLPSSKQVAFAERIARIRRKDVPRECFRDKRLMSGWIDANKPVSRSDTG